MLDEYVNPLMSLTLKRNLAPMSVSQAVSDARSGVMDKCKVRPRARALRDANGKKPSGTA